ncbi:hypothetical protein F0P96_14510 [Hymenobacter busanensis]|uniref:Uncharacterized protein n=1 Tax=Hymenobacter busanensis TaxID=2607656 RepID=A0A7L5A009_9BACT|nr:hypothetical protein [Hymenobacter busanensis]KAA9331453.1 hypothetical protein F0P96_14510 [Hymenobacter busanensis]QHJ08607.1 hypothetical protein GUY19_15440 [Hymenobacter busanensis]
MMHTLRSRLALVLLACFMRVLVPEAWILALHQHQHTEREVAHEGRGAKALLTEKHQHCGVDHLFNTPFQPAPEVVFTPAHRTYASVVAPSGQSVWNGTERATLHLRGPPTRA